jgi:Asp-tRNA(Asn)/Glu-tRNA(Gln) amidotransferase A subunit family amidase
MTMLVPRLASGEISAAGLMADCLAAMERHASLGAILTPSPRAMSDACRADEERQAGQPLGPLHGVPIVVKDNIDAAGLPTSSGNRALAHAMPLRDATQVAHMRDAGAIIIGKANLSEFSFEIRSRSSLGGDVHNPFRQGTTSGGSSGGTAVAVAAGFAVAGLGTDTGGSIRVPASYTGLVGLRPTHGVLDMGGVAPLAPSTDTIGPIARSVADARLLFEVMAGRRAPRAPRPLRVGVLRQAFGTDAEIGVAMDRVCNMLAAASVAIVDPVDLPENIVPVDRPHIVDAEFAAAFDAYLATNFAAGTAPASLDAIVASGEFLAEYADVLRLRITAGGTNTNEILAYHRTLRAGLSDLMDQHALDAILHPTSMVTPDSLENPAGGWGPELAACSGWPALSVPAGRNAAGMPIGVDLLGRAHAEPVLFALGRMIERSVGPRAVPTLQR